MKNRLLRTSLLVVFTWSISPAAERAKDAAIRNGEASTNSAALMTDLLINRMKSLVLRLHALGAISLGTVAVQAADAPLELIGVSTIPHTQSSELRYRRDPDPQWGARVPLFLRNRTTQSIALPADLPVRFRGQTANELLTNGAWTWHDTPSAWPGNDLVLPSESLTVWTFNRQGTNWGAGTGAELALDWPGPPPRRIPLTYAAVEVQIADRAGGIVVLVGAPAHQA